jgi:hypothetical protein
MKSISKKNPFAITSSEKRSIKFLMEKMNISRKELEEIFRKSGVSASKMIELMQLCKYQFVNKEDEIPGLCEPCKIVPGRMTVSKHG